jgi:hypothetical protein
MACKILSKFPSQKPKHLRKKQNKTKQKAVILGPLNVGEGWAQSTLPQG